MTQNLLRKILAEKKPILNAWLTIPDAWTAEMVAHSGFDALTIDMQHGLIGYQTALSMLQAISTTPAAPLVRVPWNDPALVMKMLDAGAQGIICPMINNAVDASRFAGACRYAPLGYRSAGPIRAEQYSDADYISTANQTVLALAMIETVEALENLEAILDTPGLDGVYVGPVDLSLSMALPRRGNLDDPGMRAALEKILKGVHNRGLIVGIPAYQVEKSLEMARLGFDLVTPFKDSSELQSRARQVVKQMRDGIQVSTLQ